MITIELDDSSDDMSANDNKSENARDEPENLNFKKRLVAQVRKHRSLYDNKHTLFSNVAKKEQVWQQIAQKLKSDVNECRDTWFQLRYSYQRYARKLRNYFIHGHKENCKRPAMGLESELMFLWRFIDNRKTCKISFELPESSDCRRSKDTASKKAMDDDLILLEPPVELIVIDEDDDIVKSDDEFKLTPSMKNLITEIKIYPELYDSQHTSFKDFARKSFIWNTIACSMNDKATKLMKCWIVMQTRYEWEISQPNRIKSSDLQTAFEFFRHFTLQNQDTVYKQSYFLKTAWYDPIDFFKDIYNLIVRMKKVSDVVYITETLLNSPGKTKQYISLWTEVACLKIDTSAGQCETTWLIMRQFYWELLCMRKQNYQLTDKWYFETIITELYAISRTVQASKLQERVQLKYTPKVIKRSALTSPISQSAKIQKLSSPIVAATTTQFVPTIINHLQSSPSTNSTHTTQSITAPQFTLPKITAAISLAPQSFNAGTMQMKQIPGSAHLPTVPQPIRMCNGMSTTVIGSPTTTTASPQSAISFNLPSQTKVTPIQMPTLIRSSNPSNAQPKIRNPTLATISVLPMSSLRPPLPNIQQAPWPIPPRLTPMQEIPTPTPKIQPTPTPKMQMQPTPTIQTTNINTVINPKLLINSQPSPLSTNKYLLSTTASVQSIASIQNTPETPNITSSSSSNTTTIAAAKTTATIATTTSSPMPKITSAISLLNSNEILIELIASPNGNQLVVHGPPLNAKYQLSMTLVAKFIREVLAIPLLHNKRTNQPVLINCYWEHVGTRFNLPVHICRACWNFLQENFSHFPQIAPLKDLMKPFHTILNVWKESTTLFSKFDELCDSKGWNQHMKSFPYVVECISGYPALYQDVRRDNSKAISEMETLCAWRTIKLRFLPEITEIEDIWAALKTHFVQYMNELEFGIENKWSENWWRSLARLKFLVETRYTANEPFYYIITNKMLEEIDKCALLEMKRRYISDLPESSNEERNTKAEDVDRKANDMVASLINSRSNRKTYVELGSLITAIHKHPVIYGKSDNMEKFEAWKKVAQELHMEVPDCLFAFKHATEMYLTYKKQDPFHRCRLNQIYYKKLDEIVQKLLPDKFTKPRSKINIKTPNELNQSVETDSSADDFDSVFPERYISDISMSNSPSNLVIKNWAYAIGNISSFNELSSHKLKDILKQYLPNSIH